MDMKATIEEQCFLCGPCQDVITRTAGAMSSVVGYSPESNNTSMEVEESPLLRAVTMQCLMKILQVGEDLTCSDL
jgi:hypothetical protein